MDATGSKMETIIRGENAARFKNILIEGQKYTIHVESYNLPLQFPLYPKQLTDFSDWSLPEHRNKMFVDIPGLIVYLGPLQRVSNRLYREVTLLDTRCELVVIRVYTNHLTTHGAWSLRIIANFISIQVIIKCMNYRTFGGMWSTGKSILDSSIDVM
uniref:Uncharacterized protein n=1 Tax=Oryza punctata TaxID=4537 RepID=A0A0E0KGQ2_ORYPU